MHSAVAAVHLVMAVWFKLDERGFRECKKTAYNISFGRAFGGVHYRSDNLYGLQLGEDCAAIVLPNILEKYGIDRQVVEETISKYRTNWMEELGGNT